jgi:hypothetical protein
MKARPIRCGCRNRDGNQAAVTIARVSLIRRVLSPCGSFKQGTTGSPLKGLKKHHAQQGWPRDLDELETVSLDDQMNAAGENIRATCPNSAVVAPILHHVMQVTASDHGTTLNNGAADAAGR